LILQGALDEFDAFGFFTVHGHSGNESLLL